MMKNNVLPLFRKEEEPDKCECGEPLLDPSQMTCQDCCEHEFDPSEGFMCINCGLQGELSDVYDEDYGRDR